MRDLRIHEQKRNDIGFGQVLEDGTLRLETQHQKWNEGPCRLQFSDNLALHQIAGLFQCLFTPCLRRRCPVRYATAELQFHLENSSLDLLETITAGLVKRSLWQELLPARGIEAGDPGEISIMSHRASRSSSKMQPGRLSGDEKRHLIRARDLISAPFADLGQRSNKRKLSATNMQFFLAVMNPAYLSIH